MGPFGEFLVGAFTHLFEAAFCERYIVFVLRKVGLSFIKHASVPPNLLKKTPVQFCPEAYPHTSHREDRAPPEARRCVLCAALARLEGGHLVPVRAVFKHLAS